MMIKRTTKDLLAESLKELCKIKSADKITIKELTQNCGLTAPTFYNHFRDKYELILIGCSSTANTADIPSRQFWTLPEQSRLTT